jgi:excisionase family DNA binding protein
VLVSSGVFLDLPMVRALGPYIALLREAMTAEARRDGGALAQPIVKQLDELANVAKMAAKAGIVPPCSPQPEVVVIASVMTCAEVAVLCGVTTQVVGRWCRDGTLRAARHGHRAWVIDRDDARQFVELRKVH